MGAGVPVAEAASADGGDDISARLAHFTEEESQARVRVVLCCCQYLSFWRIFTVPWRMCTW